ncbi:MAG: tetratricopeptide repeat protein [Gallionellaceae bacterium]|nr:tetratricopeptide repeat protein [Gallionellaceae bacterium]
MSNRFSQFIVLCFGSILLCASISVFADEIQSINKLFKQGQHEQALSRVNAYLSGKPKDAQARFLKGLILTEQGKNNDAIRVFTGLTEDYPEFPEPYNNLAVLYASQGQFDKARVALEMAIRTHPSYATAHENLGDIYAKMASQAYDRALQLDRNNAATQTKLALIKDLFSSAPKAGKSVAASSSETAATVTAQLQPAEQASVSAASTAVVATPVASEKVDVTALEPASLPNKPATKESAENSEKEVAKIVHDWAAAWSSKDVKRYLAFYAKDFKTPGGESRSEWEAQRRERITGPKTITVAVKELRVKFINDSHAKATFRQTYRASHLHNISSKTLMMVKSVGGWLIQEETTGK